MTKNYTIHYSDKYAFSGDTSSSVAYRITEPESYYAGQSQSRYAVLCRFSELSNLNADAITGIRIYIQRILGGSPITYTVNLYGSVLTDSVDTVLRCGNEVFTTNRTAMDWTGNSSDVGGEYRSFDIDPDLFVELREYGFALAWSDSERIIHVGDVYLEITTSERDYLLSYDANGGTGAPNTQTAVGVSSATLTVSETVPTRIGYRFLGWATSPSATTAEYQPNGSITILSDTTPSAFFVH